MKISVYNLQAETVGNVELADELFQLEPNQHLLAEAIRVQLSNRRTGLSHTKTRGEVSGGGKKPWKQKGTGRARAGSNRSPIWRHGGVTFGPRSDRNWQLKINKKAKTKALFMALSDKVKHNQFIILDSLEMPEAKTKAFAQIAAAFSKVGTGMTKKTLLVVQDKRGVAARSARNLPYMNIVSAKSMNVFDTMSAQTIVLTKADVKTITETYGSQLTSKVKKAA